MVSSATPPAFAPGVLNTTTPASLHFSTGMLFTPAPARPMASRLSGSSISCILALRTRMPWGASASLSTLNWAGPSFASPAGAMLFSVLMVYIKAILLFQPYCFTKSSMNCTSLATPSAGMAL